MKQHTMKWFLLLAAIQLFEIGQTTATTLRIIGSVAAALALGCALLTIRKQPQALVLSGMLTLVRFGMLASGLALAGSLGRAWWCVCWCVLGVPAFALGQGKLFRHLHKHIKMSSGLCILAGLLALTAVSVLTALFTRIPAPLIQGILLGVQTAVTFLVWGVAESAFEQLLPGAQAQPFMLQAFSACLSFGCLFLAKGALPGTGAGWLAPAAFLLAIWLQRNRLCVTDQRMEEMGRELRQKEETT